MTKKIKTLFCLIVLCSSMSAQDVQRIQKLEVIDGSLYLFDNEAPFKVITDRVLVKPKKLTEEIKSKYEILFEHCWGYFDIKVPKGINVTDFVEKLKKSGEYESVLYHRK